MPHAPQYEQQQHQQRQAQQLRTRSYNPQPMRPAGVHLQQGPMQHLRHNIRQAQSNAPPAGSWPKDYSVNGVHFQA